MTAQEMEIQELRRKVKLLEAKNAELEHIHHLDMAEIVRLRRMIDIKEENANEGIQSNR